MWEWLWRVLGAEVVTPPTPPVETAPALPPPPEAPPVSPELVEALEVTRKSARAQAKLAARVDEVNDGLNARLTELGAAVAALSTAPRAGSATPASTWNEILDAMDLLDRAIDALPADRDDGLAEGLRGVLRRLDRALALNRVERRGEVGDVVDGRVFRVLGTEGRDGVEGGRIARVVRAAALLDGKVLREGEVFATPGRTSP